MKKNTIMLIAFYLAIASCVKGKTNNLSLDETKIAEPKKADEVAELKHLEDPHQEAKEDKQLRAPRLPAVIKAENASSITFQVSGIITKINVKAGDVVKKGELLAVLDSTEAQLALEIAKSDAESKKIMLQQEEKKYASYSALFKSGSLSKITYEDEENTAKLAKLNYESAQNNVKVKEQILQFTKIVAPYDCVISKSYKSLGDFVTSGTTVFDIVQMNNLSVFAQVPFALFEKIKIGKTFFISNPINKQKTTMVVEKIVPVIDSQTRTFDVYGKISNPSSVFIPGMYVEIILD